MLLSVRSTRHLLLRYVLASRWQMKPFANVECVGRVGDELRSESFEERKHLFSDGVDKRYFRQIDYQSHFAVAARGERANVLRSFAGESAFQPHDQGID